MNADGHRLSPESKTASPLAEPNPILASPRTAFTGGCQELGDLRTEAAERNNVAKAMILHACSTGRLRSGLPEEIRPGLYLSRGVRRRTPGTGVANA